MLLELSDCFLELMIIRLPSEPAFPLIVDIFYSTKSLLVLTLKRDVIYGSAECGLLP